MSFYSFEGRRPSVARSAFVHPAAIVIGDVEIGAGCLIAAGAVLRADWGRITVGAGSNIQDNCVVHSFPDEAAVIGPEAHIGHGAIIHGATLGHHVVVGMNSVIHDGAHLGDDSVVGSASVVLGGTRIPPASLVMGVPAKVIRELDDRERVRWMEATRAYQRLTERYLVAFDVVEVEPRVT